jgi:hypothetical protein
MTCDTYGHLVPGGNRQAVDRLDDGNRMKTFWTRERISVPQVIERIGATRRSRTGDLLITKNTNPLPHLPNQKKSNKTKVSDPAKEPSLWFSRVSVETSWKHETIPAFAEIDPRHEDFQSSSRSGTMCHHRSLLVSIQAFNGGLSRSILPIRTHSGI